MQSELHPNYYMDTLVSCACGNSWTTGSTSRSIKVEICSRCHPFWTGEQRIVDTEGRVERLLRRFNLTEDYS
jgi:large subunit ribosomal protein L31